MTGYQTKTITVAALISTALAVLGWFVGAQPQLDNVSKYKDEAVSARQAADQIRANIGQLKQKELDLPGAQREYQELARQFPHNFEASSWADMIYSAARSAGAELEELSPSIPQVSATGVAPGAPAATPAPAQPAGSQSAGAASAPQGNMASSSVTISASGSSAELRDFVERLSRLPRPILVSSLSISDGDDGATVNISGTTYLMRELADPNSPEGRAAAGQPSSGRPDAKIDSNQPQAPTMPDVRP